MSSLSIFTCVMTMVPTFMIFLSLLYLSSYFRLQMQQNLSFSYGFCCSFVNNFFLCLLKLIIFIGYSLQDSQNLFIQFLILYTSRLFSLYLYKHIMDIEKPHGICSRTLVVDNFWGLFLHPSIFSINDSRPA